MIVHIRSKQRTATVYGEAAHAVCKRRCRGPQAGRDGGARGARTQHRGDDAAGNVDCAHPVELGNVKDVASDGEREGLGGGVEKCAEGRAAVAHAGGAHAKNAARARKHAAHAARNVAHHIGKRIRHVEHGACSVVSETPRPRETHGLSGNVAHSAVARVAGNRNVTPRHRNTPMATCNGGQLPRPVNPVDKRKVEKSAPVRRKKIAARAVPRYSVNELGEHALVYGGPSEVPQAVRNCTTREVRDRQAASGQHEKRVSGVRYSNIPGQGVHSNRR
jgi:hypothetical protein